jgi:putative endonuclease
LYTGITNDLYTRIKQHYENRGDAKTFAGRYYCYHLIYFERHYTAQAAIDREKQIKGWSRSKKLAFIKSENPELLTLKDYLYG